MRAGVIGLLAIVIVVAAGFSFRNEARKHWSERTPFLVRIAAGNQRTEMGRRAATLTRGLGFLAGAGFSGIRAGARFGRQRARDRAERLGKPQPRSRLVDWIAGPTPMPESTEFEPPPHFGHKPTGTIHDSDEHTAGPVTAPRRPTGEPALCGECGLILTPPNWDHDCQPPTAPPRTPAGSIGAPAAPTPTTEENTMSGETTFELSTSEMSAAQSLASQLAAQMEALSSAMAQEDVPTSIRAKLALAMDGLDTVVQALDAAIAQLYAEHGDIAEVVAGKEIASPEFYGARRGN